MANVLRTEIFSKWLKGLRDDTAKAAILSRIRRVEVNGNFGDVSPVGDGISELRIDVGAGYRVYFGFRGDDVYLITNGGTKSSQRRDIARAKAIWEAILKEQS